MTRWVEGTVSVLRCEAEEHLTPHFTFSGDTDMATAGLASLSSVVSDEIVIAELRSNELDDASGGIFQYRINQLLRRDDLRFLRLRRLEPAAGPAGTSFQDFQQAYAPARLVFFCPLCDSDAVAARTETPADYTQRGGTLTLMADLEVRD